MDHREGWGLKFWCFHTVMLEETLESPSDSKEIKPVNPKEKSTLNIFIGRTDAEVPILWLLDAKSWLIGKDPDPGKDWRQEKKGKTGWVGWMASPTQWHEFEQSVGESKGQESLVCCSPWDHKELDTTEQLNNNEFWMLFLERLLWISFIFWISI